MEYCTKNTAQTYIKGSCKNVPRVTLAQYMYCISTFIYVHKISFWRLAHMSLSRIIFAVNKFFKGINRGLILKTTGSGCESDSYRYIVSKKFGYQSIFLWTP